MERLPETIEAEHVDEVGELRKEVVELRGDIDDLRAEFKQFAALVKSARIVFGNSSGTTAPVSQESDKWEKLKTKLGGKMAQVIEALQLNSPSTPTQLYKVTGGSFSNVKLAVYKLRDMGLLVKNGDGWSLKP